MNDLNVDITETDAWLLICENEDRPGTIGAVGTLLGSQLTSGAAVVINAAQTAFTGGSLIGNNSASWNPTMVVTIPAAAVVGTYTGTVTHTVA